MIENKNIEWKTGNMPVTREPWYQTKVVNMTITVVDRGDFATLHVSAPFGKNYEGSRIHLRTQETCIGADMVEQAKLRGLAAAREMLMAEFERRRAAS